MGVYRVYTLTDRFTYVLSAFITPRAVHARLQLRLNKPRARECVGVCNVLHRGFGQKTNKTIASALTSSSRWKTMSADKRRTLDFYVSLTLSHEITRPRAPCDLTFTPSTHPPRFDRHQYYYFPSIARETFINFSLYVRVCNRIFEKREFQDLLNISRVSVALRFDLWSNHNREYKVKLSKVSIFIIVHLRENKRNGALKWIDVLIFC